MKLTSTILFILVLSFQGRCVSHFYRTDGGNSPSVRECVTSAFQSQIGVTEATNQNDGEPVKYLQSVGFGAGFAWCGAFVHWVLEKCVPHDQLYQFIGTAKGFAWTPNFVVKPAYLVTEPRSGDLMTLYYASKGRVGHVGFVEKYPEGNQVVTVEGNTNAAGAREGDGVHRKYRLKSQIYKYVDVIGADRTDPLTNCECHVKVQ